MSSEGDVICLFSLLSFLGIVECVQGINNSFPVHKSDI